MNAIAREAPPPLHDMHLLQQFRYAAKAMKHNQCPVLMEVPGLKAADIVAVREGLWRFDRELPRSAQRAWELHLPRDPEYDEPDDGAIRKQDKDWKLFFHYRSDLKDQLSKRGMELSPWQHEWFEDMQRLLSVCSEALIAYAERIDAICPGHDFTKRAKRARHLNLLRTLKYVPRKGVLAKQHTDRDAITFHMAESAPGLRVMSGKELPSPVAPQVLVFPGDQIERITRGALRACSHSVIDMTGGAEERFAMVFFGKMHTGVM